MAIDYTKGMRPNLYELMQGGESGGAGKLNIDGSNADSEGFTIESNNIAMQLPNLNRGFIVSPTFARLNHQTVILMGEAVEIDSTGSIQANAEGDITVTVDGNFQVRTHDDNVEDVPVPYIADPDGSDAQIVTLGFIREYTDTPVNILHVTSAVDPVTQGPLLTCAESYDDVWEMVNNFHKKPIMLIFKDISRITSFVVKEVSNTNSSVTVNYEKFDYYNNTLTYNYRYITVNDDNSVSGGSIVSKTWSV